LVAELSDANSHLFGNPLVQKSPSSKVCLTSLL